MQSCDELEPELSEADPLILLFPDVKDRLMLKLTLECDSVLVRMDQCHRKLENIRVKTSRYYEDIERIYFQQCREENDIASLNFATATRPSYTFMLTELKSVADAFDAEINRQEVVREGLAVGEASRIVGGLQKLLPIKREGVPISKILLLYVQFFLKQTEC